MRARRTCLLAAAALLASSCAPLAVVAAASTPAPPLYAVLPGNYSSDEDVLKPPGYTSSSHATSVATAQMKSGLSNLTLRAAIGINFLPPDLDLITFSSATSPGYLAWAAAYAANNTGVAIRIARDDVRGVLPWLLDYVAANTSATFEWYALVLPPDLQQASDSTLRLLWALNDAGMDLGLFDCTSTAYRVPFLNLTVPYTFYSHQVVTTAATLPAPSLASTLWTFLRPCAPAAPLSEDGHRRAAGCRAVPNRTHGRFKWDLWLVMLGSIFFSGVAFFVLEDPRSEKVGEFENHRVAFLRYANFVAAMSLVGTNNHEPRSASGQLFATVRAFAMWILMAAYLANFSAYLSTPPVLVQPITGFDSFLATNSPACIRNNSIQIRFMQQFYPQVTTQIVGLSTADMLRAVLNGSCAGGVDAEYHLWYNLGPEVDPDGEFCPLQLVGARSTGAYPYVVPVGPNVPLAAVNAMSLAIQFAVYNGQYGNAEAALVPTTRPAYQCYRYLQSVLTAESLAASSTNSLGAKDMAGLFIVLGAALLTSLLLHFLFEREMFRDPAADAGSDAAGGAGGGRRISGPQLLVGVLRRRRRASQGGSGAGRAAPPENGNGDDTRGRGLHRVAEAAPADEEAVVKPG